MFVDAQVDHEPSFESDKRALKMKIRGKSQTNFDRFELDKGMKQLREEKGENFQVTRCCVVAPSPDRATGLTVVGAVDRIALSRQDADSRNTGNGCVV